MFNALLSPVIETLTIIAFLAAIGTLVWYFLEKTQTGDRFKAATPWMGWDFETDLDEDYTNFTIHPSNFIQVPDNR